jgi:hypothetical protein
MEQNLEQKIRNKKIHIPHDLIDRGEINWAASSIDLNLRMIGNCSNACIEE